MTPEEKRKKKEEYQNRYHFYADKRISQLSFLNNFMLTISIALIAYIWTKEIDFHIANSIDSINWKKTFLFIILSLSSLSGFILSISRLYDMRLTSNKLLTRKRALELDNVNLNDQEKKDYTFLISLFTFFNVIFNYSNYEIKKNEITNKKFIKLQETVNAIESLSWKLLNYQIILLALSIIFLFFQQII